MRKNLLFAQNFISKRLTKQVVRWFVTNNSLSPIASRDDTGQARRNRGGGLEGLLETPPPPPPQIFANFHF